jgi:hypothetical protein
MKRAITIFVFINFALAQICFSAETALIDEQNLSNAKIDENWQWDNSQKLFGDIAHTNKTSDAGLHSHRIDFIFGIPITEKAVIRQHLYLSPEDSPQAVMLKFGFEDGTEAGVFWEDSDIFELNREGDLWYYGSLPPSGQWVKLEVPLDDIIDAPKKAIKSIEFINYDGKAWWDRTELVQ